MKTIFTAIAIFGLTITTASAADPSMRPDYNWTGFYTGLSVGYGVTKTNDSVVDDADDVHNFSTYKRGAGVIAGVQAGYNFRYDRSIAGIEVDYSFSDVNRTSIADQENFRRYTSKMDVPWFATLRGRLGFLPTDQLMIYATGGVIYGRANQSRIYNGDTRGPLCGTNCSIGSLSEDTLSWVIGAGFEYFVARSVTLKFEYLYADLGGQHGVYRENLPRGGLSDVSLYESTSFGLNIFRVGLNYHY